MGSRGPTAPPAAEEVRASGGAAYVPACMQGGGGEGERECCSNGVQQHKR